jgi:hypothetical protein
LFTVPIISVQGGAVAVAVAVRVAVSVAVAVEVAVEVGVEDASGVWVRNGVGVVLKREMVELKAHPLIINEVITLVMVIKILF